MKIGPTFILKPFLDIGPTTTSPLVGPGLPGGRLAAAGGAGARAGPHCASQAKVCQENSERAVCFVGRVLGQDNKKQFGFQELVWEKFCDFFFGKMHLLSRAVEVRYSVVVTIDRLKLLTKEHHCLKVSSSLVNLTHQLERPNSSPWYVLVVTWFDEFKSPESKSPTVSSEFRMTFLTRCFFSKKRWCRSSVRRWWT